MQKEDEIHGPREKGNAVPAGAVAIRQKCI